jgi:hypothetical protein
MAPTAKERSAVNSQAEVVSLALPHRTQAEEVGCRFPFLSRGDPKAARVPISDNYLFMPSSHRTLAQDSAANAHISHRPNSPGYSKSEALLFPQRFQRSKPVEEDLPQQDPCGGYLERGRESKDYDSDFLNLGAKFTRLSRLVLVFYLQVKHF